MDQVKDLILIIARALVDHPEQVSVREIESGNTVIYELLVSTDDIGRVIGKRGRTVNAIRTLLSATSGKARKRYMLEIIQ